MSNARFPWRTLIFALATCAIAWIGYLAVRSVTDRISPFSSERITQAFLSEIPRAESSGGDILELATATSTETFRAENSQKLWDFFPLGTNVTEIRVPVTFRYHLKLSDPWRLETRNGNCIVHAPAIRPTLPPAIHTDRLERRLERGWARFDGATELADLERSLTDRISERAADPRHMALSREACRKSVADFVKRWLLREKRWSSSGFGSIVVIFPDESPSDTGPLLP